MELVGDSSPDLINEIGRLRMRGVANSTTQEVANDSAPLRTALLNRMRERAGSESNLTPRRSIIGRRRKRINSLTENTVGQRKITDIFKDQLGGKDIMDSGNESH